MFRHEGHAINVLQFGPPEAAAVVLHHGLLEEAATWQQIGYVDALAGIRRVVVIDSFGHGASDDVELERLQTRRARADLVVAVADDLGIDTFDFVGYSMGGWVGGALLRHHRHRISSVSIGGWDLEAGIDTAKQWTHATFGLELDFDLLHGLAQAAMPGVAGASDERVRGWRAAWDTLGSSPPDDRSTFAAFTGPIHLWCGRDDAYHAAMEQTAQALGARFDSVAGDHMSAFLEADARAAVAGFLAEHDC